MPVWALLHDLRVPFFAVDDERVWWTSDLILRVQMLVVRGTSNLIRVVVPSLSQGFRATEIVW